MPGKPSREKRRQLKVEAAAIMETDGVSFAEAYRRAKAAHEAAAPQRTIGVVDMSMETFNAMCEPYPDSPTIIITGTDIDGNEVVEEVRETPFGRVLEGIMRMRRGEG